MSRLDHIAREILGSIHRPPADPADLAHVMVMCCDDWLRRNQPDTTPEEYEQFTREIGTWARRHALGLETT